MEKVKTTDNAYNTKYNYIKKKENSNYAKDKFTATDKILESELSPISPMDKIGCELILPKSL